MCMIVDANVVSALFNTKHTKHADFTPVLNWILYDKGKIVFGGSKMGQELSKLKSYLKILNLFDTHRKIVHLDNKSVDDWQSKLEQQETQVGFNDAHILAMIIVSKVRILCTTDIKSLKFVKKRSLYPSHVKKPKIYSRPNHSGVLNDENIASICKPCLKGSKDLCNAFAELIEKKQRKHRGHP